MYRGIHVHVLKENTCNILKFKDSVTNTVRVYSIQDNLREVIPVRSIERRVIRSRFMSKQNIVTIVHYNNLKCYERSDTLNLRLIHRDTHTHPPPQ